MTTLSRTFLILAGLAAALWLRGGTGLLDTLGLPFLAVLALGLALLTAPSGSRESERAPLSGEYAKWLEAWRAAHAECDGPWSPAGRALRTASARLAVVAPDRVLKSLMTAEREGFRIGAVANLVVEMRRSIGRPSLTVRPTDLERLLGESIGSPPPEPAPAPTPAEDRAPAEDQAPAEDRAPAPDPVSFLG